MSSIPATECDSVSAGELFKENANEKFPFPNPVVVKDELDILVQHPEIANRKVPILFFANKMDCSEALSAVKIATGEEWGIHS